MNPQEQIEAIDHYFPELVIEPDGLGKFTWTFRCTNSEDDFDEVFDSPIEALAHFAQTQVEAMQMLQPESGDEEVDPNCDDIKTDQEQENFYNMLLEDVDDDLNRNYSQPELDTLRRVQQRLYNETE